MKKHLVLAAVGLGLASSPPVLADNEGLDTSQLPKEEKWKAQPLLPSTGGAVVPTDGKGSIYGSGSYTTESGTRFKGGATGNPSTGGEVRGGVGWTY